MNIGKKIQEVRRKIVMGLEPTLANDIARDGRAAIFAGIGTFNGDGVVTSVTPEWTKLMTHFKNNDDELKRLCGQEKQFNQADWGLECLAYIAGDSTCTSDTTYGTGTKRSMLLHPDRKMLEILDKDMTNTEEPPVQ